MFGVIGWVKSIGFMGLTVVIVVNGSKEFFQKSLIHGYGKVPSCFSPPVLDGNVQA
jgi:hypothetical protein